MDLIFPSERDFDNWNKQKKELNYTTKSLPNFVEKEVWWTTQGINIGDEIYGKPPIFTRPAIIIRKYNKRLFFGALMSTKAKANKYYIPICVNKKVVFVIISQLRTLSSKRLCSRIGEINDEDFRHIADTIKRLCLP